MNKVVFVGLLGVCLTIFSCTKPVDFVDDSSQYPIGWTSTDSFDLISNTVLDSIGNILNIGTCPLGSNQTSDFGLYNSASYLQFQTTTSSLNFGFTSLDSAYLFVPYSGLKPVYGSLTTPYNIEVYEMSENFDTSTTSKKMDYQYYGTPVGTISNYIPNYKDSAYDGSSKVRPYIKIPLSLAFANKLIAPGSYASNDELHNHFKGLYIKTTGDTKGFIIMETTTALKIKLYGRGSSGLPLTSEFVTGGTNSITVNQLQRDPSSKAYIASQTQNPSGSSSVYLRGLYGHYGLIKVPDLVEFAKNKTIFKAELILYSTDTAFSQSSLLGVLYQNDSTNKTYVLDDQYRRGFYVSVKNTTIQGIPVVEYKFNIGSFINSLIANGIRNHASFKIYPLNISLISSPYVILSNYLPAVATIGGNTGNFKPRLKIYYTTY